MYCIHWLRRVTDTSEFQLSSVNDSAESWHLVIYYAQNLIFTYSAVSMTPLRFDLAMTMTPLSFHTVVLLTPLSDDSAAPLAIWNSNILTSSPRFSQIQWARKIYAAVAENYANSKYYTVSRVKEELERHCFRHLTQLGQGFLMIKYQLLKMYSLSAAGPQSFLNFLT